MRTLLTKSALSDLAIGLAAIFSGTLAAAPADPPADPTAKSPPAPKAAAKQDAAAHNAALAALGNLLRR